MPALGGHLGSAPEKVRFELCHDGWWGVYRQTVGETGGVGVGVCLENQEVDGLTWRWVRVLSLGKVMLPLFNQRSFLLQEM